MFKLDFSKNTNIQSINYFLLLFVSFLAQESSGKTGVLGPTKIYLAVQPNTTSQAQPPPLTPVKQSDILSSPVQQVSIY